MSDDKDYAHTRDPEAQRTRRELWVILAIVFVVVAGALAWRVVAHKPARPQNDWAPSNAATPANTLAVPAAAGVHTDVPAPRPAP